MTREAVANILQNARVEAGLTQAEAANAISRKREILSAWETGRAQPDVETLFALFDVYGASVDEAFGFTKQPWYISSLEMKILEAYRQSPEYVQAGIATLLQVERKEAKPKPAKVKLFQAAMSDDGQEAGIVEMIRSDYEKLKNAPDVEEI